MGLTTPTLHKMFGNSYAKSKDQSHIVNGYEMDHSLSGQGAQVYHNKDTNYLVVAHRDTKGIHDVRTDMKLIMGFKKNKRFQHGKDITDKAIAKYKTDNVSVIGHSLGSAIASESNKTHKHETIGLNGAIVPIDLMNKQRDNEHMIRSKYDPVSALHLLKPHKNKTSTHTLDNSYINPLKAHSTDVIENEYVQ